MRTLRISVRRLVEFLLRAGDIDSSDDWRGGIEAILAGGEIHRRLQAAAGSSYQAEVSLGCSVFFPGGAFSPHAARLEIREDVVGGQDGFFLCVEGRADGIVDDGVSPLVVDEIKGVSRDVSVIDEPVPMHEAQALCYAYLYLRESRGSTALSTAFGERVVVRITYASMTTGEVRQIERGYDVPEIEAWFFSLLEKAQRWAAWRVHHDELRERSLSMLEFPLRPRAGQREIVEAVAAAIREGARLYVQAPTGSGKTVATMYPALKAMGAGEVSRVVFLTAKTMTRRSALECLDLFRQQGFAANVLVMTARDKICPLRGEERGAEVRARPLASLCNPAECPFARGHYDLVNDALYEAIRTRDVLDSGCIEKIAACRHVCPYELQRDAARWADVVICDYHYAFSPSASLIGLADEPGSDTVFLVDESHNLVERMREMYSAELSVADLTGLERLLPVRDSFEELRKALRTATIAFPSWDKALNSGARSGGSGRRRGHQVVHVSDTFSESLSAASVSIDAALEELSSSMREDGSRSSVAGVRAVEAFLSLRDVGLKVRSFLGAMQRGEVGYVTFLGRAEGGGRKVKVLCVDPSHDLDERLEQAKAAVFFSGTLLPMGYHRKLLAARDDDVSVYARSSFDNRRRRVLIGTDVTARFSRRGPKLYDRIARYIVRLTRSHPGNYLVFLPSYAMLGEVAKALDTISGRKIMAIRQRPGMREGERERFVDEFRKPHGGDSSLVGLCVLGGIFGESIDLPGESLVGVVVVGTGMPGISDEREVIKDYFDAKEGGGFSYAYTYPGMIKVLQAAGRLIRTEEDYGVVLLLDDRFLDRELRAAFPREWENVCTCTLETL